ncbi:beta-propeller fold lactonase family protein, partial [Paenarthrobacter ureafaciens]|uniref:beta-propeller fold lactonase family protein n=1 Tax=Paenarthrobacter ureafaciens TaxID=37931 RepID=UPI00397DFD44
MSVESMIWTGSYTADRNAKGEGIGAIAIDGQGNLEAVGLAVTANSPSFLARHPTLPILYAVAEEAGTVQPYRRTGVAELEPF